MIYGTSPFPIVLISSEEDTEVEELAGGKTRLCFMFYFGKQKVQGAFSSVSQHELE